MNKGTEKEISKLQDNLLVIRRVAGWTTEELGDLIGVTKQTVSNLENKKTKMSKTQYIAIRAILDYEIISNPDNKALPQVVTILLDSDDMSEEEQQKVNDTMAFVSGAAGSGLSGAAIATGMGVLLGAAGVSIGGTVGVATGLLTGTKWLLKIIKESKG